MPSGGRQGRKRKPEHARARPARATPHRQIPLADVDQRLPFLFVVGLLCVLLLLFVNSAFRIDDPLFIWAARHIQAHPGNPYGFQVNWYGTEMAMADVTKNPPLASYYIALVASAFGWSERVLHLAFLLPALATATGMFLLARRWCANPALAVLAGLLTPVFLVSSVTVMCDVLMLAFWVWAVHCWMTGLDRRNHLLLFLGSLLIVAAALSKYFGMTLIPLLLVYSAVKERRAGPWGLHFIVPVLALAAYEAATYRLYGRGLLLDATVYATEVGTTFDKLSLAKTYVALAFTGGCVATVVCFARQLWSRAAILVGLACAVVATLGIFSATALGNFALPADTGAHWLIAGQLALWATAGVSLLTLAALDVAGRRDADSLLLFLWTIGTFVFAGFINWSTNGRSVLPITVPAGILIARRLEQRATAGGSLLRSAGLPLALAGTISLAVTWADARFAETARAGARAIFTKYRSDHRTIWFEGHSGFQYYMEARGAKAFNVQTQHLTSGDLIVAPTTNSNVYPLRIDLSPDIIEVPSSRWLATMNLANGAGFYSDVFGPLPFALGPVPAERFFIVEVRPAAAKSAGLTDLRGQRPGCYGLKFLLTSGGIV